MSDNEKSELFANQNSEHESYIQDCLDTPLPLALPPLTFTPSEVLQEIRKLPKRKFPGQDLITAEILLHILRKGIVILTTLLHAIVRTTKFPMEWKSVFSKI